METFVSEISIRQITKLYALVATLQQPLQFIISKYIYYRMQGQRMPQGCSTKCTFGA